MLFQAASYQTSDGKKPFDRWLEGLRRRDHMAAVSIDARLARIRDNGNFGDHRSVGHGIFELRLHLGSGYRVYYLLRGFTMIVLLCGGEKDNQRRDIAKAHQYAEDFWRRG